MKYVLFYDSGVGGLLTLKQTMRQVKENYIYFADNLNCPIGNKSQDEILEIVKGRLNWLFKRFNIKLVVFACNTITACCIDALRGLYPVKMVGIEPAIVPALKNTDKDVLVLATKATMRQEKFKRLAEKGSRRLHFMPLKSLAYAIEKWQTGGGKAELWRQIRLVELAVKDNENIGAIVLGCTHYSYIKEILEKRLGIQVFDGNDGVARRVKSLLNQNPGRGRVKIILTKGRRKIKKTYYKIVRG